MKKTNKEMVALAILIMLLSGCDNNINTVVKVGYNNRIMVSSTPLSDTTGIKRIITVPVSNKNRDALKYTLPGDKVKISGKNYDRNRVMNEARVKFNRDTIYARQQRELFEQTKERYFKSNGR